MIFRLRLTKQYNLLSWKSGFKCDRPGGWLCGEGGLIFLSRDLKHDWTEVGINYDDHDDDNDDDYDYDYDEVFLKNTIFIGL